MYHHLDLLSYNNNLAVTIAITHRSTFNCSCAFSSGGEYSTRAFSSKGSCREQRAPCRRIPRALFPRAVPRWHIILTLRGGAVEKDN